MSDDSSSWQDSGEDSDESVDLMELSAESELIAEVWEVLSVHGYALRPEHEDDEDLAEEGLMMWIEQYFTKFP